MSIVSTQSGIEMDKNTRLSILRRAQQILFERWGKNHLYEEGTYCLLGACERAAYDLGFATEDPANSFDESEWGDTQTPLGYLLGKDLSLDTYVEEKFGATGISAAWQLNDRKGREETLDFLSEYIGEVERGRPR